jgi:hypothetical protein
MGAALNSRQTFEGRRTDIALIQDPYVYKNQIKGLNSKLSIILVGTRTGKRRTCMLISNDIQASLVQEFNDQDQVAVQITFETEHPAIGCSVYIPFDSQNSHHVAWGSTDTNSRGSALLEHFASSNLEILNRGNEPTFVTRTRYEVSLSTLSTEEYQEKSLYLIIGYSGSNCRLIPGYLNSIEIHYPLTGLVTKTSWPLDWMDGTEIV